MVQRVDSPVLPRLENFPHAMIDEVSGLIHVSAQAAFNRAMEIEGIGDLAEQTRRCFLNIGIVVEAAGSHLGNTLSTIAYVVGLDDEKVTAFTKAMAKAIADDLIQPHATTVIGVARLPHPHMLIESSAVATSHATMS